ncbi:MAG: MFS transporter [Candidatus Pacearchaeota archaeon]|nr:MFS transporter [Candidatus Pacearchaeota archaeon]
MFNNHNLNKLYLSEAFRNFSISMISIFVPIYLIIIGYNIYQVALFFLLNAILCVIISIPIGKFGARFGFKYLILISMPFQILFFALLFSLEDASTPLYLLVIVKSLASRFYHLGKISLLAKFTEKGKRGAEVGVNKILNKLSSIPGPLIGGYLLTLLDTNILLFIILIFLLFATAPLFFIKEKRQKVNLNLRNTFQDLNFSEKIVLINKGIDDSMDDFVWPVYAFFFILNEYFVLGLVKVVQKSFSLVSHYVSGKLFDKNGVSIIRFGGIASLFIWIGRIFAYNPFFVYIVDSFRGLLHPLIATGFDAECYELADTKHKLISFIMVREILIHVGRIILFGVLLVVQDLKLMLFVGIIYSLIYMKFKFDDGVIPTKICENGEVN